MEILQLGDEVLRQKSVPVVEITEKTKKLITDMFATMDAAKGVGLAAPQVGVLQRIFVIRLDDNVPHVFVNPTILETSVETSPFEEGCLSIHGVFHTISRPSRVKVQALDENGKVFVQEAEGALSRTIQHENDHLNGILYIDYADEDFRVKTVELFQRRAERRLEKKAAKKARAARIAVKQAKAAQIAGKRAV
jgi:peptide deformylase